MRKFCCRYVRLYANSIWFSLYHRTKIFRYLIKKLTNIQMEMLTNSLRISPQCAVFCRHYFTRKRIIVTSFFVLSGALSWEPQESISPKTFNQHKHVTYDVSSNDYRLKHGLRTPREKIAFTAQPKIQSQSQIFRYGRSIFCLPHRPNFSDIFDLCLHWVSVVRGYYKVVSV